MSMPYLPRRGDVVRIGRGKKLWIVDRVWERDSSMVSLNPVQGYSGTSCAVGRLLLVERAPAEVDSRGDIPSGLAYGVDESGAAVAWPVDEAPHSYVIGGTPRGRGRCLRSVAQAAVDAGIEVFGVDPTLIALDNMPGVAVAGGVPQDIAGLVAKVYGLMEQRYGRVERGEVTSGELGPVLLVVNELELVQDRLRGSQAGGVVRDQVWALLSMGRSVRVHVAIGMSQLSAVDLPGDARVELRHQLRQVS